MIIGFLCTTSVVVAQDTTTPACPDIVQQALQATDNACQDTGRNEACYGNVQISATPQDNVTNFAFDQQGDKVSVADIQSLQLAAMDTASGAWGVAVLKLQADIPDTLPGQNVTFLLFGNVQIENPDASTGAFYFKSGVGDAACTEAPDSGILVKTPDGVDHATVTINDVEITLGSTAYLQAEPSGSMLIALAEGHAVVQASGETQEFDGGNEVTVPLDENLQASGPPTEPQPIPDTLLNVLPLGTLDSIIGAGLATPEATGAIVPQSGTWTSTAAASATGDCPSFMTSTMTAAMQNTGPQEVTFGDTFGLQEFITLIGADIPGGTQFDNPSPNVYTMTYSEQGVAFSWEFDVLSPTQVNMTMRFDINSDGFQCSMEYTYTSERTGD